MDSYNLSSPVGVQATVSPGGEDQDYWQHLHGGSWSYSSYGGHQRRGHFNLKSSENIFSFNFRFLPNNIWQKLSYNLPSN
jgi:hypothetical protein